jgi:hypothetical protein
MNDERFEEAEMTWQTHSNKLFNSNAPLANIPQCVSRLRHFRAVISINQKSLAKLDEGITELRLGVGLRGFAKLIEKAFVGVDKFLEMEQKRILGVTRAACWPMRIPSDLYSRKNYFYLILEQLLHWLHKFIL